MRTYKYPESTINMLEFGIRYILCHKNDLEIVQIGAFDGEVSDPLKASVVKDINKIHAKIVDQ